MGLLLRAGSWCPRKRASWRPLLMLLLFVHNIHPHRGWGDGRELCCTGKFFLFPLEALGVRRRARHGGATP